MDLWPESQDTSILPRDYHSWVLQAQTVRAVYAYSQRIARVTFSLFKLRNRKKYTIFTHDLTNEFYFCSTIQIPNPQEVGPHWAFMFEGCILLQEPLYTIRKGSSIHGIYSTIMFISPYMSSEAMEPRGHGLNFGNYDQIQDHFLLVVCFICFLSQYRRITPKPLYKCPSLSQFTKKKTHKLIMPSDSS